MISELQLITGIDIPVPEIGLTLRQPNIRDISMLGEQQYFTALSIFITTADDLKNPPPEISSWDIFAEAISQEIEGIPNTRVLLTNFLQLFLPQANIGPRSLLVQNSKGEITQIEKEQFPIIQELVGGVGGAWLLRGGKGSKDEFKPVSSRAAEIAEKMKKGRAKLAAAKQAGEQKKSNDFIAKYVRAAAVVTANSLKEVTEMTLYQLMQVVEGYLNWEDYDLEIKNRLAGAKGEGKLEHWMMREPKR